MKELSIFIDESGDLGFNNNNPSYYIATFIFHNQFIDISDDISKVWRRKPWPRCDSDLIVSYLPGQCNLTEKLTSKRFQKKESRNQYKAIFD